MDELDRSTQREAATVELVNQFTEQTNFESAWAWALNLDPGPARTNSLLTVIKKIDQIQSTSAAQLWMQDEALSQICLLYTSPSPRDKRQSRMPSSA